MLVTSQKIREYFDALQLQCRKEFDIANSARALGYDPDDKVEVQLASNMAERVVGLISVVAPQIVGSGVVERIIELEQEFGALDWRIALQISLEVAQEKFCKFKDQHEAIEVGVRVGFAYGTVGVVSSPIEGLISIELKNRLDNKGKYFCLNFGGPVRNAGGTAASWSVIIADYVRKKMGFAVYDPDENEIKRCYTELEDYHERITNLQYFPSKKEVEFLMAALPVEISGDASEDKEVSNYKDLPRVPTNKIRSGFCLIHSSCIPLKAEKLWKQLSKWGGNFDMEHWNFLEQFIKIKKEAHAKGKTDSKKSSSENKSENKITPDFTYIADLVAGRPVISHPLRAGGFRLRYGRSRTSGYSAQSIHPATMHVLNNFIAIGTQLKVERPGKGAAFTPCDTIDGPIVKLKDGSVVGIDTEIKARELKKDVVEVLFLGDVLINYGDFLNRNHVLVPPGYCEEWWVQELEKKTVSMFGNLDSYKLADLVGSEHSVIEQIFKKPLKQKPSAHLAVDIAKATETPLHPCFTYFWNVLDKKKLSDIVVWLAKMDIELREGDIVKGIIPIQKDLKRDLELLGIPHITASNEFVVFKKEEALILTELFQFGSKGTEQIKKELDLLVSDEGLKTALDVINAFSPLKQRDKCGLFIGARMGRPEKAKMRKLTGSPHVLFPVGEEGGRLRSFQSALEAGKVTADFSTYLCKNCNKEVFFGVCPFCGKKAVKLFYCKTCGPLETSSCPKHGAAVPFSRKELNIAEYFNVLLAQLNTKTFPDLIKGVRGTSNREHVSEHLLKGILRAKHNICVNKEGTTRYDCSELPITHFRPKEIDVGVEKLKSLGYEKDVKGASLKSSDQVLELFPQDILLPCCPDSPDEPADAVMIRTSNFIDEELEKLYGISPYYNVKKREDLVGQLVIGLAPHTSAGTLGRIVGFTKSQGFMAHPMMHAALRRDCFAYDTYIPLKQNNVWRLEKIGELVEKLSPSALVDDFGTREIKVKGFKTLGLKNNKITEVDVNNFTKHLPERMLRIKTRLGRVIKTTIRHRHVLFDKKLKKDVLVRAFELKKGDFFKIPYSLNIKKTDIKELDLLELFKCCDWVMVRGLRAQIPFLRKKLTENGLSSKTITNYILRDSVPVRFAYPLLKENKKVNRQNLFISAKRDHVKLPLNVEINKEFLKLLGLYVAEGYSRRVVGEKGLYQVYIAAGNKDVRAFIVNVFFRVFGLIPSEKKKDRVTYSSRIVYELFTNILAMGSSAYEKRMPSLLLTLPNEKLCYLLSGYFEGDGSVSTTDLRITFDTVSKGLLRDIDFIFGQLGVFVKNYEYTKKPGPKVREFYIRKGRQIPEFTITKGIIQSIFVGAVSKPLEFISAEKQSKFRQLLSTKKPGKVHLSRINTCVLDEICSIEVLAPETSYCLNVENNLVIANSILTRQCDGDEACFVLLLDAFLNFSRKYLPDSRGSTMDAPLVLTSILAPTEVDDMVFDLDRVWSYPLEFYEACLEYKAPWEVKIQTIRSVLNTEQQYEGLGFTHDTDNINAGVLCSSYKTLPSMQDKLLCQMDLAQKIRAVDAEDVARLVIEKHFIRDIRGNLRKFSQQEFRCVACNAKFRRPPLLGKCTSCGGKIVFTVSEGSIVKYLEPSISLAEKYVLPNYLKQSLELVKRMIEGVFGKEKEKQLGLGAWFG